MIELQASQFGQVSEILSGLKHFVHLDAVIDGQHPGRVFADRATHPTVAFVWTKWGYTYLAGDASNAGFNHSLCRLLAEELIPASIALGERGLILCPFPEGWKDRLGVILPHRKPMRLFRRSFTFHPARFATHHGWESKVPAGFRMQRLDAELIERTGKQLVTWRSRDDFLERGFGFCLLCGDNVVSECFSAFVSGGKVEISIDTAQEYRRRGLATLVASAFIEHCLAQELEPNWECWWENVASCGLAAKLGFKAPTDHAVYYWEEEV
jgi:RimJ/RimL family protein N-acetyltransferase